MIAQTRPSVLAPLLFALASVAACTPNETAEAGSSSTLTTYFRARLVISEVMASPVNERSGEFIELANVTGEPIDVSKWRLVVGTSGDRLVAYRENAAPVIPPRSLALVIDRDFANDFALPEGVTLLTTPDHAIGIGIAASHSIQLLDEAGAEVDHFSPPGYTVARGTSFERRDFYAPSTAGNWSKTERGSPGRLNATTPPFGIRTVFGDQTTEDALVAGMVDFIDSAKESIDAQLFQFRHAEIAAALKRAAVRTKGRVRLIADTDYRARNGYLEGYQDLAAPVDSQGETYAVEVAFDGRSSRAHNKFLVADRARVWVGSYNPTGEKAFNNVLVFDSPAVAAAFAGEFAEMWGDPAQGVVPRFGKKKSDNTAHEFEVAGQRVGVYFAPTDGVREQIVKAIEGAKKSIQIEMFSFNDPVIGAAVMKKVRGDATAGIAPVKLRGVMDHIQAMYPGSQYQALHQESLTNPNVDFRVTPSGMQMHNKLAIIDGEGDEPVVVTGSYNWSGSRADTNDESVIIVRNRQVAKRYALDFEKIWFLVDAGNNPEGAKALRITEVMSTPDDDGTGEFIEIYNFGAEPANLEGLFLNDGTKKSRLMARAGGATVVEPGAFAVVVDKQWKGSPAIPEGTAVLTVSTSAICGTGIAANETITLETPRGRVLDRWSVATDLGAVKGLSVERVDRRGANGRIATTYRTSTAPGGSAGRVNAGSLLDFEAASSASVP
ncbi:MAG: lamin tail domain-containing protein [Deltaproteobacteria bacterium]|nr:lamin tail domain-containing protein [Deltaproteobacteria bacterium]